MDASAASATAPPQAPRRDVASQAAQAPGAQAVQGAIFATLKAQARAMAHDLGNPLTGLSLTLELLGSSQLSDGQRRYVDRCLRVMERLNSYKEGLGHLGSPQTTTLAPVSVQSCLDVALAKLNLAPAYDVAVALDPGAHTVLAQPQLLAEALTELLRNASQALGQGGAMGVRGHVQGKQVVLTVWDRGPGLSAAAEAQLWLAPIAGKAHSAGLGLFWAAAIVDQVHRGRLSYSREPQGGAAFHVALAAAAAP